MYQNAADSDGCGWSERSLQRRPFQCVLGQASRAFSSMSIVAPNCCQRAVLHNGSICTPPSVMLILFSRVCLLLSMSILELLVSRRLDRDPSQSIHAQREGKFTSMMEIVLTEMPDHPLACISLIFSILI